MTNTLKAIYFGILYWNISLKETINNSYWRYTYILKSKGVYEGVEISEILNDLKGAEIL
jgi:hypothetical protein